MMRVGMATVTMTKARGDIPSMTMARSTAHTLQRLVLTDEPRRHPVRLRDELRDVRRVDIDVATLLHDARRAGLDEVGDKVLRHPGVVLANERARLVASTVPSAPVAVAKKVVQLLLDGDEKVVVE